MVASIQRFVLTNLPTESDFQLGGFTFSPGNKPRSAISELQLTKPSPGAVSIAGIELCSHQPALDRSVCDTWSLRISVKLCQPHVSVAPAIPENSVESRSP